MPRGEPVSWSDIALMMANLLRKRDDRTASETEALRVFDVKSKAQLDRRRAGR